MRRDVLFHPSRKETPQGSGTRRSVMIVRQTGGMLCKWRGQQSEIRDQRSEVRDQRSGSGSGEQGQDGQFADEADGFEADGDDLADEARKKSGPPSLDSGTWGTQMIGLVRIETWAPGRPCTATCGASG